MSISQINAASIQPGTVVASDIAANTITQTNLTIGAPYWNSSNQVGIGTSAPGYPLDVQAATGIVSTKSTNNLNTSYFISNNGAGATAIGIDSSSGTLTGAANASFVWSSVNSPLIFSNNSTERMRINTNGAILANTTTQTGSTRVVVLDGTGGQYRAQYNSSLTGFLINQYDTAGDTSLNVQDNAALTFATNNSERMRITATGNVAIGSTSANFSLSFGANIGKSIALYESSGTNMYGIGMGGLGTTPSPYRTQLFANGSEYVSITATGNVGIGIVNPSTTLNLYSSTKPTLTFGDSTLGNNYGGQITGYGVSGNGGYLSLGTNDNNTYNEGIQLTQQATNIIFKTSTGTNGTTAERMRINSSGVVAIGRTSAYSSEVLSVQGNIGVVMPGGSGSYPTIQFYNTNGVLRGAKDGAGAGVDGLQLWQSSTVNIGVYPSNVGIGTTSPGSFGATQTAFTAIQSTSAGAETMALCLVNNSSSTSTAVSLGFAPNINVDLARITALRTDSGYSGATDLLFKFWDGSNATEKFRIKNTGTLQLTNSSAVINNSSGRPILRQSGSVLQVVTNYPTTGAVYSQAVGSYAEISADYRTAITPVSTNSILILEWIGLVGGNDSSSISTMKFYDITNNADVGLSGITLGSRGIGHASFRQVDADVNDRDNIILRAVIPNSSTTARTYSIYHYSENSVTKYFNATATDNSGCSYVKWHFIITEIAA